jgi:hypothetical protein
LVEELASEVAGYYCLPYVKAQFTDDFDGVHISPDTAANSAVRYFNNRKSSIYGGSNAVQTR